MDTSIEGAPISISWMTPAKVVKLNEGLPLARNQKGPDNFWEFLAKWGGEWMWEGIDKDQTTYSKLTWLLEGMQHTTLLWVTDRSYYRKRAADLSGVRWVIMCTTTGN